MLTFFYFFFMVVKAMAVNSPFEFFLQWHLTERCNLSCQHCYQSGRGGAELTLAEIGAVAAEAAEMVQEWERLYAVVIERSCNVTGGEPLLRRDLDAILAVLGEAGFALDLLSNGTLIDAAAAQRLAQQGVRGVQISLEGPQIIHDQIRGAGSYQAALGGCRHLREAGLAVSFNVTLSRLNAPYLEEIVALAATVGVTRVGFARLVPAGQGALLRQEMLAAEEVADIYRRLFALAVPGVQVVTGDPVAAQLRAGASVTPVASGGAPCGGCAAGVSGLTLLADGTLLPCRRLEVPLGNVRRHSLREIWATSPVLRQLRTQSLYHGKCASCALWNGCRGCRAIAYACSATGGQPGDYLASDPQCFIAGG
ncbi:MAG: hypothetical protein A2091_09000 [Desulfuromonadales bacterium GWD2_61_12]|nr:MAG: hypothetical protein A2091_09000 [Desulfuromonadales bacterium GWD2_61_12]